MRNMECRRLQSWKNFHSLAYQSTVKLAQCDGPLRRTALKVVTIYTFSPSLVAIGGRGNVWNGIVLARTVTTISRAHFSNPRNPEAANQRR